MVCTDTHGNSNLAFMLGHALEQVFRGHQPWTGRTVHSLPHGGPCHDGDQPVQPHRSEELGGRRLPPGRHHDVWVPSRPCHATLPLALRLWRAAGGDCEACRHLIFGIFVVFLEAEPDQGCPSAFFCPPRLPFSTYSAFVGGPCLQPFPELQML